MSGLRMTTVGRSLISLGVMVAGISAGSAFSGIAAAEPALQSSGHSFSSPQTGTNVQARGYTVSSGHVTSERAQGAAGGRGSAGGGTSGGGQVAGGSAGQGTHAHAVPNNSDARTTPGKAGQPQVLSGWPVPPSPWVGKLNQQPGYEDYPGYPYYSPRFGNPAPWSGQLPLGGNDCPPRHRTCDR